MFGDGKQGLKGFTDANRATQEHRHAISRYAYILGSGAVSWVLKKQVVILSITEVKYIAATHAEKKEVWLHWLVEEIF